MIEHITNLNFKLEYSTSVTIGNFDGVHTGHRKLINEIQEADLKTVVFSFNPHPAFVFNSNADFKLITTSQERKIIIDQLGIDILVEYPFSKEFANLEPEYFAEQIIFKNLSCRLLVTGANYRFGKNRKGDIDMLTQIGKKYNAKVTALGLEKSDQQIISSTQIREFIREGSIKKANQYLGDNYKILGTVTHGKKLGRTLGFPTLNIIPEKNKLLPRKGVYLTQTKLDGTTYTSLTNVGTNPTVDGQSTIVETYVVDFNQDAYDKEIIVSFIDFIREEKKFASIDDLKHQMEQDKQIAKDYILN